MPPDKPPILGYRSPSQEYRQSNTAGLTSVACAILAISAIVGEILNGSTVGSKFIDTASWLICLPAILIGCISGVVAVNSPKNDHRIAYTGLVINSVLAVLVFAFIYYAITHAY